MDNNTTSVGEVGLWVRLDQLVKIRFGSYRQMAQQAKINLRTLYGYKQKYAYPPIHTLKAIATTLDVSLDWLVSGDVTDAQKDMGLGEDEYNFMLRYKSLPRQTREIIDRILSDAERKKNRNKDKDGNT